MISRSSPVAYGAMMADDIPTKLKIPNAVESWFRGVLSATRAIVKGSVASFPKNPYQTSAVIMNAWLFVRSIRRMLQAASGRRQSTTGRRFPILSEM